MDKKIVIIFQKQYEEFLRNTVTDKVDVVFWLPVELLKDDAQQFEQEVSQLYGDNLQIIFCLMISWRPNKQDVLRVLGKLGIASNQILDVYKAYMAKFPIRRYQRIMEQRRGEVLDGLILGISHGMVGIVEEMMPGKVCNLCESSQDIYFNYAVLENVCNEYPESIKELKYVVFDMFDYTYFNFDTLMTGAYEDFLENGGFWCENRCNWNKQQTPEQINEWLEAVWQEGCSDEQQQLLDAIFPNMHEKDDSAYKGSTILEARKHTLTEAEIESYQNNLKFSSIQAYVFENTVEFQISNFEMILQLLKKINPEMKIFLLLMPKYYVVEQCEKIVNIRWKSFFKEIIEGFREEYPALELVDMKACEEFSKNRSFYEDMTHFNYQGACKFTEYLSTVLRNEYGVLRTL